MSPAIARQAPDPVSDEPPEPATVPPRCPFSRSLSYSTWQYSVHLDYAGLTDLMDEVFDLWERVEAEGTTEVIDDRFEALTNHIMGLREWTGWDGVPGEYLR